MCGVNILEALIKGHPNTFKIISYSTLSAVLSDQGHYSESYELSISMKPFCKKDMSHPAMNAACFSRTYL